MTVYILWISTRRKGFIESELSFGSSYVSVSYFNDTVKAALAIFISFTSKKMLWKNFCIDWVCHKNSFYKNPLAQKGWKLKIT